MDAELALGFLTEHSIAALSCASIGQLGGSLPEDAGCIVLTEEALMDADFDGLRGLLEEQEAWSDLPLVLVASENTVLASLVERAFPSSGNVTVLQRPLNPLTLVSAVRAGLRARVRQLEVRQLLDEREQTLKQRDDFLAMLAHELRNPLAPMRNAIWLQKSVPADDTLAAKTREILDRQITHLSRMVDDLVDIARFERGKVELRRERLDLNRAMLGALDTALPLVRDRSHEVVTEIASEPLYVEADPVRLEQLLSNLILNACKFTPTAGRLVLRTEGTPEFACAAVHDNGIGMPPDRVETLFAPFAQGEHSLARSAGGLGIGLSIARSIAELHGGRLTARSAGSGKGSTFTLELPRSTAAAVAAQESERARSEGLRRRILVIEDNADIRETLSLVLGSWGHEVLLAHDGALGLELAMQQEPDVALIDIGLPGMSGYDVARELRAHQRGADIRTRMIALTGYGQAADRKRAMEAGFDAHLVKPVDPAVLPPLLHDTAD